MVSVPIQKWVWGDDIIPFAVTVGLTAQFVAVFYILMSAWGFRRTIIVFLAVAAMTWFAEFIGSTTGIPFGDYTYTDILQPQLAHVPLVIPIAWFMMLPSAWSIAQILTQSFIRSPLTGRFVFAAVSAIALTAWDLFLDPQMVSWGFWEWTNPTGYFGIPWINYGGWLITAFIITLIIQPQKLPTTPLLLIYGVVWFLQSFGQFFFWDQQGPAIVGCLAMGFVLFLSIRKSMRQQQ